MVKFFYYCIRLGLKQLCSIMTLSQEELNKECERLNQIRRFDEKATGRFIDEFVHHFKKYLKGKVPDPKRKALDLAHQVVEVLYCKENLVLKCKLMTYSITIAKNLFSNEQQKKFNHPTEMLPLSYFENLEAEDNIYEQIEESEIRLLVNIPA
ncbi:MAG: hypothetical protein D4R64_05860 [Porphyromonadaceae bacterium]|nr:MAG: hypothetical protein D4R64_05860 [Porphyromonadaceae bacterium]